MRKQFSGTLILMSITLVVALLVNGSVQGKKGGGGGGKGGGDNGGAQASYDVFELIPIDDEGDAYDPAGISEPDADGNLYVVGSTYNPGRAILWQVNPADGFQQTTQLPFGPSGVNAAGVVVGTWSGSQELAVAWLDSDRYNALPMVLGDESSAWDVNDNWEIVGRESSTDPKTGEEILTGVYWRLDPDWTLAEWFSLGDFLPVSISDAGLVAGRVGDTPAIADLNMDPLQITFLDALDGATHGYGIDVNNFGEVAGHQAVVDRRGNSVLRAYRWSEIGGTVDIGTLAKNTWSKAWGVNDTGHVVGESSVKNARHAYHWDGQNLSDLNDLIPADSDVEVLWSAWGINNAGQIICRGWNDGGGRWQVYLLTPLDP